MMKYKYELPSSVWKKVETLKEFANGATQVSVLLANGDTYHKLLISDGRYIIAMRDKLDLPFDPSEIIDVYQEPDDENPLKRGGWKYWDNW